MLLFGALLHVSLLDIVNEDNDALHNYGEAGSILDTGFNVIVSSLKYNSPRCPELNNKLSNSGIY